MFSTGQPRPLSGIALERRSQPAHTEQKPETSNGPSSTDFKARLMSTGNFGSDAVIYLQAGIHIKRLDSEAGMNYSDCRMPTHRELIGEFSRSIKSNLRQKARTAACSPGRKPPSELQTDCKQTAFCWPNKSSSKATSTRMDV